MKDKLIEVRKNARRMHESYLRANGLFTYIIESTSGEGFEKWNIRDRIDFLIEELSPMKCYCGGPYYVKPGKQVCSARCAANEPSTIAKISEIQRNNKVERAAKARKTYQEKYGVTWNNQLPGVRESKKKKRDLKKIESLKKRFSELGLDSDSFFDKEHLSSIRDQCKSLSELSEKYFNGAHVVFIQKYYAYHNLSTYAKTGSIGEDELDSWIRSLGFNTVRNTRSIIAPREIDIYIPELKLGIEFDGIYWHSTKKSDDNIKYHVLKTEIAERAGIGLMHVYESELKYKPEIIKSILLSKFGKSEKVYARKTTVREINVKEAREFFDTCHLQGFSAASNYIALTAKDEIVMCISIGKSRFTKDYNLELIRMASKLNTTVVGGFSKLMKYVRTNITTEPILTYCDRKLSTGKTYSQFGCYLRTTEPGYSWHSFNGWYSRYQTQKSKLKKLVPNHYREDLTERQIMENAGYFQLYDCGNFVYVIN